MCESHIRGPLTVMQACSTGRPARPFPTLITRPLGRTPLKRAPTSKHSSSSIIMTQAVAEPQLQQQASGLGSNLAVARLQNTLHLLNDLKVDRQVRFKVRVW